MELLFQDRDEYPLKFDSNILSYKVAITKIRNIVSTRIELMDMSFRNDKEGMEFLASNLARVKIMDKNDKAVFHYEGGKNLVQKTAFLNKNEKN